MTDYDTMSYAEALANAIPLTHENAPGFVSCVQDLAEKAGVGPLHVELIPSMIPNAHFRHTEAGRTVSFSTGMFHILDSANVHAAPSTEMQAVISHELSHARHSLTEGTVGMALLLSLPLIGAGAMYLIDKTNDKLRNDKRHQTKDHPDHDTGHPQSFWSAFQETLTEVKEQGVWNTLHEFSARSSPLTSKLAGGGSQQNSLLDNLSGSKPQTRHKDFSYLYKDMPWGNALMEEAKYLAVGAAMLVPALSACRNLSFAHEYRADRFSVGLTGNKEMASALRKLAGATEGIVTATAKTPLEKNWAKRIVQKIQEYAQYALFETHPATSDRIATIEKLDISDAARHFGL